MITLLDHLADGSTHATPCTREEAVELVRLALHFPMITTSVIKNDYTDGSFSLTVLEYAHTNRKPSRHFKEN